MKKLLALILAALLILGATPAFAAEEMPIGKAFPDFTFTDTEGDTYSLSGLLAEKDLVVLNIFASWCPPCKQEFPEMEAVYEQLSDRMAIVALSGYFDDTMEIMRQYKADMGLTFPVGLVDGTGIDDFLLYQYYPTNVFIDRFGNVGFITNTLPSGDHFSRTVKYFLKDDYTETAPIDDYPAPEMDVPYPDEAALSGALNAEGGALAFVNDPKGEMFPFLVGKDGAAWSSNNGMPETRAWVQTTLTAGDGDALAFRFEVEDPHSVSRLEVWVDGVRVKAFAGRRPWTDWAVPLTAGEHTVGFMYNYFDYEVFLEEGVGVDDVRLLSGDEAARALAAVPAYAGFADYGIVPLDGTAREAVVTLDGKETWIHFYVANGETLRLGLQLPEGGDPDAAMVIDYTDRQFWTLSQLPETEAGNALEIPLNDPDAPADSYLWIILQGDGAVAEASREAYVVPDESLAGTFLAIINGDGELDWKYVDDQA